jgi:hypothetical protein
MLDTIITETTTPAADLASRGWISGSTPHGVDYMSKIARKVPMYSSTVDGATYVPKRRFAFKLDKLGFFRSQHYLPLEWIPVTIEIILAQPNTCLRKCWSFASPPAVKSGTPVFKIEEPTFHCQLLTFNSEVNYLFRQLFPYLILIYL